jgi:hypothetical protein
VGKPTQQGLPKAVEKIFVRKSWTAAAPLSVPLPYKNT